MQSASGRDQLCQVTTVADHRGNNTCTSVPRLGGVESSGFRLPSVSGPLTSRRGAAVVFAEGAVGCGHSSWEAVVCPVLETGHQRVGQLLGG